MTRPFAAPTATTPGWMAPPDYRPRHAAPESRTAVDPALRLPYGLLELKAMFAAAHRALLGGVR